jgi:hypothetical protein
VRREERSGVFTLILRLTNKISISDLGIYTCKYLLFRRTLELSTLEYRSWKFQIRMPFASIWLLPHFRPSLANITTDNPSLQQVRKDLFSVISRGDLSSF